MLGETKTPNPQHDTMLQIEKNLLLFPIVADKRVQSVTVRHPADQAGVR